MECRLRRAGVHYQIHGEGRPLLALHGWGLDHRAVANPLESILRRRSGWKRIYPDLPGMGKTKAPDWLSTSDQVLDVLVEFIDRVAPGERMSVLGVSYGGYLAQGLVHRLADRLEGVCLISAAAVPAGGKTASPTSILRRERIDFGGAPEERVAAFREAVVVQTQRQFDAWERDVTPAEHLADARFLSWLERGARFSFDASGLPRPFPGPALFVCGRQDGGPGHRDAWSLVEVFPRATFAVLDRAGNLVLMEQAGLLASLVTEWLDRVEESSPRGLASDAAGAPRESTAPSALAPAKAL